MKLLVLAATAAVLGATAAQAGSPTMSFLGHDPGWPNIDQWCAQVERPASAGMHANQEYYGACIQRKQEAYNILFDHWRDLTTEQQDSCLLDNVVSTYPGYQFLALCALNALDPNGRLRFEHKLPQYKLYSEAPYPRHFSAFPTN